MDVVLTWVDDQWPGYREMLASHSGDPRDLNPNRTRDNLDIIRYAIRSLDQYLPDLRRIYLLSMRPQVPAWLDTARDDVVVVHHDEVMAPEYLPTFNSFAIVSHLHLLPGLSSEFLYVEDDMLLGRPSPLGAFRDKDGRHRVPFSKTGLPEKAALDPATASPWNLACAQTREVLTQRHGHRDWMQKLHWPILFDRDRYAETIERYGLEIAATRAEKFRSAACVAPELLDPLDAWARGLVGLTKPHPWLRGGYASVENIFAWTALQLAWINLWHPPFICLNDSFDDAPNPRVEAYVRNWLQTRYPRPSRFERASTSA